MKIILILWVFLSVTGVSCAQEVTVPVKNDEKILDLNDFSLVFSDEFDGSKMDWSLWEADNVKNVKHETSRGREAVSVENGELRLNVKRVNRPGKVKWIAGYVYLREPLEHNVYIETRFKSGDCSGVNNAFWLACKTPPNNTWQNKYEVDIVEARKNIRNGKGDGHLAWHDWKTYPYTLNAAGNKMDIAQGIKVEHDFDEYHVWGLWYGENELVYYLDGKEMWRGKTHDKYPDQYCTGVGKASVWKPDEEKRAYGRFGQDDWCYYGGYNGDAMHIILANIPWGESWSPLVESEADGTYMAVDYVRIYKPKQQLNKIPDTQSKPVISSGQPAVVALNTPCPLDWDGNFYFSLPVSKKSGDEIIIRLLNANQETIATFKVDAANNLLTGFDTLASTALAYPAKERPGKCIQDNTEFVLVGRVTARSGEGLLDKDAVSFIAFPSKEMKTVREPYFYPNIDDSGNTSVTNEWPVNRKGFSSETVEYISIQTNGKTGTLQAAFNFDAIR